MTACTSQHSCEDKFIETFEHGHDTYIRYVAMEAHQIAFSLRFEMLCTLLQQQSQNEKKY